MTHLITIEQAVEAVNRCTQAAGGLAVEDDVLDRACDALRALPPAEPSDKPSAGCLWCGCERIDWEPTDTVDAMALRCLGCGRWTSPSLHDPPTQRMAEATEDEVERVAEAISEGVAAGLFRETGDELWRVVARAAIAATAPTKEVKPCG